MRSGCVLTATTWMQRTIQELRTSLFLLLHTKIVNQGACKCWTHWCKNNIGYLHVTWGLLEIRGNTFIVSFWVVIFDYLLHTYNLLFWIATFFAALEYLINWLKVRWKKHRKDKRVVYVDADVYVFLLSVQCPVLSLGSLKSKGTSLWEPAATGLGVDSSLSHPSTPSFFFSLSACFAVSLQWHTLYSQKKKTKKTYMLQIVVGVCPY